MIDNGNHCAQLFLKSLKLVKNVLSAVTHLRGVAHLSNVTRMDTLPRTCANPIMKFKPELLITISHIVYEKQYMILLFPVK